jgi:hypothetical protein
MVTCPNNNTRIPADKFASRHFSDQYQMSAVDTSATVLFSLEELFTYNASISLPPTRSARMYYLWTFSIATAYAWVCPLPRLSGTLDGWKWEQKRHLVSDDQELYCWMTHCLLEIQTACNPTFKPAGLLSKERHMYKWNVKQQEEYTRVLFQKFNFAAWKKQWKAWWTQRAADGSVAAMQPPAVSNLPNGSTVLDVSVAQNLDDTVVYPHPEKWTPLKVQGKSQRYLTMNWGSVTSPGLSAAQEEQIRSDASKEFLGTSPARTAEITSLLELANNLSEENKLVAEFWAGGPGTISPPGMVMWIWLQFMRATNQPLEYVIWSGLDLTVHLFEGSRLTWALKKQYMEARPIQVIRHLFPDSAVSNYTGGEVPGALWTPYQTANFVTPPFADFPSGHSTFSQSFALVMNRWFGEQITSRPCADASLQLLSPLFEGFQTITLKNIQIRSGSSEIQPGVVPSSAITLHFNTWQDMAESAGISRQYGGIHAQSAHLGGQAVARGVHEALKASWKMRVDMSPTKA